MPTSMESCRVAVRSPAFNSADPELWFAQLEGQFILSSITTDNTKFYYVLSQLEPQHTAEVRDIIVLPPATGRYEKLKAELIRRLSASQERKIKQLLTHAELGDRKPSQFLRHLQYLAGANAPGDFIRTIWTSRLPTNLQTIVASHGNMDLEELAQLADQINDIVPVNSQVTCASTGLNLATGTSTSISTGSPVEILSRQMETITQRLEAMEVRMRSTARSRSRGPRRYSRSRSRQRPGDHPYCWYHYRFKERARKCTQPCSFQKSGNHQGSH
ncbi:hypothetical protein K1T71_006894 [Dendrolimus kikuchii]|uniref:Uncharacterized protein n=1 Tax=Dendrolimus kikuchii TaxID=765133 RepID=A0ACC1D237_9NEOP|nr:hypothetical protein K1T71_006894 [Dendrolimus kikuchii]